jgi:hypothetical protein
MSRLLIASLFVVGLLLTASSAQDVKVEEKKVEPKKVEYPKKGLPNVGKGTKGAAAIPGDVEIHFLDGSKVRLVILSDKLDIATQYGKLAVPVKDVRAIEFGIHYPDDMEAKIEAAIKNLGSGDYREREKADKALVELGPFSYAAVLQASRAKEVLEVSKRAKEIVVKLEAKHPKKDLKTSADDRVVTHNFTIVGRILTPSVKAKTGYFGEQDPKLSAMRTLKAMGGVSADMQVTLDAGKYANLGQWLDTGFQVDGQTAITISATGSVDVWPQQGGQFQCGPGGYQNAQNARNNGGNAGKVMGGRKIGRVLNNQLHCGMLLGKIGENGEMFMIADGYDGTPDAEGTLFLHIGPSQWNVQCVGSFDVKISVKQ